MLDFLSPLNEVELLLFCAVLWAVGHVGIWAWFKADEFVDLISTDQLNRTHTCRNCFRWDISRSRYNSEHKEVECPCIETLRHMRALDGCDEFTPWAEILKEEGACCEVRY